MKYWNNLEAPAGRSGALVIKLGIIEKKIQTTVLYLGIYIRVIVGNQGTYLETSLL